MSQKAEKFVNEALDAMEVARAKIEELTKYIEDHGMEEEGADIILHIDDELSTKMTAAYSSLEDLYGLARDLGEPQ